MAASRDEGVAARHAEWRPDPFGRHQERRFIFGIATSVVRDGSIEGYDVAPSATPTRLFAEVESSSASQDVDLMAPSDSAATGPLGPPIDVPHEGVSPTTPCHPTPPAGTSSDPLPRLTDTKSNVGPGPTNGSLPSEPDIGVAATDGHEAAALRAFFDWAEKRSRESGAPPDARPRN
jgi:hypothetical protein